MATVKNFTSLEQSKVLTKILPIESADMHYHYYIDFDELESIPTITEEDDHFILFPEDVRCWSLAALLEIIRNNGRYELQLWEGGYTFEANGFMTESYFNPIDTCYEMILELHKLEIL